MSTAKLKLLKETFENKFDIERFKTFTREFFNKSEILISRRYIGIWREYQNSIISYTDVARFNDANENTIVVLAVELKSERGVERSRSLQRNFVSKILDDNNCEAAIVAFYSEQDLNWRLSFVRLDYTFKDKGLELDLTPARRYSYLVGEHETSHTAQKQLYPIFEDDKHNPTLDEIEEAFSVEKVTKDFFEQYKNKYYDLKEYIEKDEAFINETKKLGFNVSKFSEQFSKKLMGQLAFLYFLQKKGWLGVRIMPESHTIEKSRFMELYNTQDDLHKEILKKFFDQNKEGKFKLSITLFHSITGYEADLLSDCFVDTKLDMNWGSGDKKFIRGIFDFCVNNTNKNFFDDYLEPFFYEGLNKRRKNQFYKQFNCKIPFLNGGLFEPLEGYHWKEVNFEIPNSIFSNFKEKGREADGILDIFDRYNFTINEYEPLEKEVAVDPEMLGKIFENLLDGKDRKAKGAFYTPREIVHYMCQESIINYLVNKTNAPYGDMKEFILYGEIIRDADNRKDVGYGKEFTIKKSIFNKIVQIDKALENIKIADPAVGSGAFPLGMLNEIVRTRNNITEYIIRLNKKGKLGRRYDEKIIRKERSQYRMKWDTIKNCIFAVDIEPSAVDIAKLRLWLSVVVEQEINEENKEPHPLPNLDCNIMVGNSLIDEYEGIKLFDKTLLYKYRNKSKEELETYDEIASTVQLSMLIDYYDQWIKEMFDLQNRLFDEDDANKKKEIKERIDKIRDDLIEYKLNRDGNKEGLKKYNEMKKLKMRPFFIWELEFAKVFKENGGFDVVIGNPPYVGEEGHKEIFRSIANTEFGKKYYRGKMDLWYFFTSKGIELLKIDGIISFIAPNNWMTTAGGSKMRKHIANETTIERFITFRNLMVFENASQQTMIFVLKKTANDAEYTFDYSELDNRYHAGNTYIADFLVNKIVGKHFKTTIKRSEFEDGRPIQFLNTTIASIIYKIKSVDHLLLQNYEITNGIHPHHAVVTKKMLKILKNRSIGEGIFVLTEEEVNSLNIFNSEKSLLKPCYDSTNIGRYKFNSAQHKWIIYTTSDFKDVRKMNNYPNIKKHLDRYVSVITSDNKPYGLHRARKQEFFELEKIVSLRKCKVPTFMYINEPAYVMAEYNIIRTKRINMVYLLGVLNSKLVTFWLKYMGKLQGNIYQVDKEPLVNIPIVIPDKLQSRKIQELVLKIITNIKLSKETTNIENEVNQIVYKLYRLNSEEISIVEEV